MLKKIKLLLGLTSDEKDELLITLIEAATEEATNYTHNNDISQLEYCICSMVVYRYNRIGTEGMNSESYSGVKFDYTSEYPSEITRQLKACRKLRTC